MKEPHTALFTLLGVATRLAFLKMSKIELLRLFLNERLTAAADEIFGTIEKTIVEYQEEVSRTKEENSRLRRMLRLQKTGLGHFKTCMGTS